MVAAAIVGLTAAFAVLILMVLARSAARPRRAMANGGDGATTWSGGSDCDGGSSADSGCGGDGGGGGGGD